MFLLVKEIDNEKIIIGTAQKKVSLENSDVEIYEISDDEYNSNMIYSKIDGYEEE